MKKFVVHLDGRINVFDPRRAELNGTQNAPVMGSSSQTLLALFEDRELSWRFSQ